MSFTDSGAGRRRTGQLGAQRPAAKPAVEETEDEPTIDISELGDRLLALQGPDEAATARRIFQRLKDGEDIDDLGRDLERLTAQHNDTIRKDNRRRQR